MKYKFTKSEASNLLRLLSELESNVGNSPIDTGRLYGMHLTFIQLEGFPEKSITSERILNESIRTYIAQNTQTESL